MDSCAFPSKRHRAGSIAVLCWATAPAVAQCSSPALWELGGEPGPVCAATFGTQVYYEAVARGRFVSIESSPLISGGPAVYGQLALDHPAQSMHTEIVGRVWATDGATLYGLDTSTPTSPQILGRLTLPSSPFVEHVRIHGNFVYAIDSFHLCIVDVTNPAAPVVRSTTPIASAFANDIEVIGSFAYISIDDTSGQGASMVVMDVGNPLQPVEVRRVGNSGRSGIRVSKAANISGLYALSKNSAAGAIEFWSLANPSNPTLWAVNATLDPGMTGSRDEFRATNAAVCYLQSESNSLSLFDTSTLALIGPPTVFPRSDNIRRLGTDPPFAFITRESGELVRVNISAGPPIVSDPYFDVTPGYTQKVATLNEGYSVLTGLNDLWFFRMSTQHGVPPLCFAHLKGDAGFAFNENHLVLCSGGVVLAVEYPQGAGNSRILAYQVNAAAPFSVQFQGSYDVADFVEGFDAGYDSTSARRVYFTTGGFGGTSPILHVLDASNLGAMSQIASFALTTDVYGPLRFLPADASPPAPQRVLVGGYSNKTQIVSVAAAGALSSLGVIPSSSTAIWKGLPPTVWIVDSNLLKAYDLSTPAAPVLQSTTKISSDPYNNSGLDLKPLSPVDALLGVTTSQGDLVKVLVPSPTAPVVSQIARINSTPFLGVANGLAFDGSKIHIANGSDGYTILPLDFSAPPREDPNFPLGAGGTQGILAICPGSPLAVTAHFVAVPAVDSYQWLRYNRAASVFEPLANGPTGSGSTVSGATTATLNITNPGDADATWYRCQATNTCDTVATDSVVEARLGGYANCDNSSTPPVLNVNDFICFLNAFAAADHYFDGYANCDGSTATPQINVNDFLCFLNKFAAGCP